jgi:hypothetical protein
MKLILSGSTGLVGREVIRQALLNPGITSVIALTRRPIDVAAIVASTSRAEIEKGLGTSKELDTAKVKSVLLKDFTAYNEEVKKELADADACIWTLALTPMRSKQHPWDEVVRITKGYCMAGMQAIADARRAAGKTNEFRFVYVSANGISPDMKRPLMLGDYMLMRVSIRQILSSIAANDNGQADVEKSIRGFTAEHAESGWKACIVKPGLISGFTGLVGTLKNAAITAFGFVGNTVGADEIARAMLKQCVDGLEKETLENLDLVRLGRDGKS